MTTLKLYTLVRNKCINNNYRLITDTCSICGYYCNYYFENEKLYYDSGCNCLKEKLVERRYKKEFFNFVKANKEELIQLFVKTPEKLEKYH